MKWLHFVAFTLLAIGGVNWGLVGLLNMNLVTMLFGSWPGLVQIVYILIGASAVYVFVTHKADCKICSKMKWG